MSANYGMGRVPTISVVDWLSSEFGLSRADVFRALAAVATNMLDADVLRGACGLYRDALDRVEGQGRLGL